MPQTIDIATMPSISIDPERMAGQPCIRGTRFPVEQLLAELADGDYTVAGLADDFDLDREVIAAVLNELAQAIAAIAQQ